jgi:hypothetical protein
MKKRALIVMLVLELALAAEGCRKEAEVQPPEAPPVPKNVVFAGVRSSEYGIKPFPEPSAWQRTIDAMNNRFPGSLPGAIWIVGELKRPTTCRLFFPSDGKTYPNIEFAETDKHEEFLRQFDKTGTKVFLQVEPAQADVPALIDLVLGRYKHHPCVVGFGVDVEWHRESDKPGWGIPVDDETARQWEARVKAHNPSYRLFLKHWDLKWMPENHRGDIIFIDDGQEVKSLDELLDAFQKRWADHFYPSPVFFQIGYNSDKPWWQDLDDPPLTIGRAIAQKVKQDCGIIWVDFSLRDVFKPSFDNSAGRSTDLGKSKGPLVGVKIYAHEGSLPELFAEWRSVGVNTVFVSPALAAQGQFRELARRQGISLFLILPVFFNPEELATDPDLYALTDRGEKAKDDWVEFVCPTRHDYLNRRIEWIKALVRDLNPDGISLDFIRYFVFWEMVYPERTPDSIANSCFDRSCLERFQTDTGIALPEGLGGTADTAKWIMAEHGEEWTKWKCGIITDLVRSIVEETKAIKPELIVNLHSVPWRETDFGGSIRVIAGQDLAALAGQADMISPMCYWHMLKRKPPWVHEVVEDAHSRTHGLIVPSIQVGNAYVTDGLSTEEFKEALEEALRPPSGGVIFWKWDALAKEPEKKSAVAARLKDRN